jgi:hypothetical protein
MKARKKDNSNFVLSIFRVFVIKKAYTSIAPYS